MLIFPRIPIMQKLHGELEVDPPPQGGHALLSGCEGYCLFFFLGRKGFVLRENESFRQLLVV